MHKLLKEYAKHDFNKSATAEALGISRVTLYNRLQEEIDRRDLPHTVEQYEREGLKALWLG